MSLPEVCVVYLMRQGPTGLEVLLGQKLTGLGQGKVVAPGGKLEVGESPHTAAVREVREEVGLELAEADLELVGELSYRFPTKPAWSQKSWAFRVIGEFGEPIPSDELSAGWVKLIDLPVNAMWDDARYWVADALMGTYVKATFEFGADLSTVSRSDHPRFGSAPRR